MLENEQRYYLHVMLEMKSSWVRVTYLASGLEWMWALSGGFLERSWIQREGPGVVLLRLDSKEGSQVVLGALDLKEKKKQVMLL